MRIAYKWAALLGCAFLLGSCNDEWKDEQYYQYVSFIKNGYNIIHLKYDKQGGDKTYTIPITLSGSTMSSRNITINTSIDHDTIPAYNFENFRNREDLYFRELDPKHYNFETMSAVIPAGSNTAYLTVDFKLKDIDMIEKHMLPLQIDLSDDYTAHPRKFFKKTLMHLELFNNFSGKYSVSGDLYEVDINGETVGDKIIVESRRGYVVDERAIFFYAGYIEENAIDRGNFRIKAEFAGPDDAITGKVTLSADNPNIAFKSNNQACSYTVESSMDSQLPYLKRIYTTLYLEYEFTDKTNATYPMSYKFTGTMVLERKINILIPEEDQQFIFD